MRIAIPLSGGQLSQHFGHSEQFLLVDADIQQRRVLHKTVETAPDHAPGLLPQWLVERGVGIVIASGVGARARELLSASSVQVFTGALAADPEVLVSELLNGKLEAGGNRCDHSGHSCGH